METQSEVTTGAILLDKEAEILGTEGCLNLFASKAPYYRPISCQDRLYALTKCGSLLGYVAPYVVIRWKLWATCCG
jgi:hypothetical protein